MVPLSVIQIFFDFKASIFCGPKKPLFSSLGHCPYKSIVRDNKFRGKSAKATLSEWYKVRDGEKKNIFPFSGEADAFFNSNHSYEITILKKYAQPLLEEIGKDEPEYAEARRLLEFLRFFDVMEDDSAVANNSILREFIGGSVIV